MRFPMRGSFTERRAIAVGIVILAVAGLFEPLCPH